MKSFKQMRLDGEFKRADGEQIELHNIHAEPGFNPPDRMAGDDEKDEQLFQFIMNGGFKQLPEIEVRPRAEGGVWIVEGHRRIKQITRAVAAGAPIANKKDGKIWIPVRQFKGSNIKRFARVITSAERKEVSPASYIHVYQKLHGFNLSPAEIAAECNTKEAHVRAHLALGNANHDVQQMVAAGDVSPTLAVTVVKKHGEAAGEVLDEALQKARIDGKKKVTAKSLTGSTPKNLPQAIQAEIDSGGKFRAEDLVPKYKAMIDYLRNSNARVK